MNITKIIEIKLSQEDLRRLIGEKALSMGYQIKGESYYDENGNYCTFADEFEAEEPVIVDDVRGAESESGNEKRESESGIGATQSEPPRAESTPEPQPELPKPTPQPTYAGSSSSPSSTSNATNTATANAPANATNAPPSVAQKLDLPYKPNEFIRPATNPYQSITNSPLGVSPPAPNNSQVQNMMEQFEKAKEQFQQSRKLQ